MKTQLINKSAQRQSQLSQARRIISARQIQKLAKDDNPVFLAIVQSTNEAPYVHGKKGNKRSPGHVTQFAALGLAEGQKRLMNRKTGPKKDIITGKEREQQVLNSVPDVYRKNLEKLIKEYQDIFPEKLPKGVPSEREVQHQIEIEPGSKPPHRLPYRLGPAE